MDDRSARGVAALQRVVPLQAMPTTVVLETEGRVAGRVLGQIDPGVARDDRRRACRAGVMSWDQVRQVFQATVLGGSLLAAAVRTTTLARARTGQGRLPTGVLRFVFVLLGVVFGWLGMALAATPF